jgi:hypothetical protein
MRYGSPSHPCSSAIHILPCGTTFPSLARIIAGGGEFDDATGRHLPVERPSRAKTVPPGQGSPRMRPPMPELHDPADLIEATPVPEPVPSDTG